MHQAHLYIGYLQVLAQHCRDNVAPKPEDIQYRDALDAFRRTLEDYADSTSRILQDMVNRGVVVSRSELLRRWGIARVDAVEYLAELPAGSVDLILTSPPYYGVADYIKSQRLSFLW